VSFLKRGFRFVVVIIEMEIVKDLLFSSMGPLVFDDLSIQDGMDGIKPGWFYDDEVKRLLYLGQYPMEDIKRVD